MTDRTQTGQLSADGTVLEFQRGEDDHNAGGRSAACPGSRRMMRWRPRSRLGPGGTNPRLTCRAGADRNHRDVPPGHVASLGARGSELALTGLSQAIL